jgi:hypothetical protein
MLEIVLGDIASWRWLYLATTPSHVQGVDVDGLACPLTILRHVVVSRENGASF